MFEHRDQRAGNKLFVLPKGGKVQERKDRIKKKKGRSRSEPAGERHD